MLPVSGMGRQGLNALKERLLALVEAERGEETGFEEEGADDLW